MSSYEEKYKKALKSIEEIIKANKQIKDELDALRTMRQADLDSFANIQKQQFRKAYDALLKDKNAQAIALQTLELQNQKLKYTVAELENQVALYRNERTEKLTRDDRETLQSNQDHPSPRKLDGRDPAAALREKEAEFHRTIENYEEHHSNLQRNAKRLQERIGELEAKLSNTDKNWRVKYEAKEFEVIDIKAQARQEFTDQIFLLRKENSALKLANSELALRLENADRAQSPRAQAFDWEGDLLQEMIAVRASMEPLRQQIGELQEMSVYQREQSVRERTNLQTRVLELQAEAERLQQTLRGMERRALEAHQERSALVEKAEQLKRYQEENQLLNGRIIVMESREIALRNRTGEELEERVLEFENRIELLLANKEGLRELREVGIHQLLALKAYILELDSRLKELLLSNGYLLKKYKSYKEKYQGSLKQHKQLGLTINTLKMKILGYDKLVLKLQGELERLLRVNQAEPAPPPALEESSQGEIYRRKYELMKEKLQVQEKYKEQELETYKLGYQTRIMELTIRAEETRSLRETIELYRSKNEELQTLLSRREAEIFESKVLTNSKAVDHDALANTRQTKDIISNLHASIKQNDETIFRLQGELRTKEEAHKRTVARLERELEDLKEDHARELGKREMDYAIALQQELKKYKLRISDLEHAQHLQALTHKDEHYKKNEESGDRVRKLEARLQEAESKREEEVFNRRRLEKQLLDLTHDREEAQRTISDLNLRLAQLKTQEKEYLDLKGRAGRGAEPRESHLDYELQSKDAIIKRLNAELLDLKSSLGGLGERDITISSQRNEIFYLKKEVEELNDTINKYNNEILFLKGTLDSTKTSLSSEVATLLEEKENALARLRKDLAARDTRVRDLEEEVSRGEESLRKVRRELAEVDRLREEAEGLKLQLQEKDRLMQKLRESEFGWDEEVDRLGKELAFVKENYQKVSYELLDKDDQISKLGLELNAASLRTREQLEGQYSEELMERERQVARLNSELLTLRSTLALAEDDRAYHQESYKRATAEAANLRSQLNQLQEQAENLSNQLYYKTQEVGKLQFSLQALRAQEDELSQRTDQAYRLRTEIFSLKSDISNLQEEVFNREAANARLANEISYVRNQHAQLEEELSAKQQILAKLTYEYSALKETYEEATATAEERTNFATKLTADLNSAKNGYRELEEEMEEREQQFSLLSQEVARLKNSINYYEEQVDQRNTQLARTAGQREMLKAEIVRLNELISEKNQEVNRAKQEVFSMRLEAGERDYEEKMRIDQEMYALRTKISALEHDREDRDSEIRRLQIDLDALRHQPQPQSSTSQQQVQELRTELGKRQRDMINMKFDLQDRQYQLETMTNNANMLRNTLNQYQQRLLSEREQYEAEVKEYQQRERKWQEQIAALHSELDEKTYQLGSSKPVSFAPNYSEQEVLQLRQQVTLKQRELSSIKYELEDKLFILQSMESKTKMQESLLKQIEEQYNEDRQRYEVQIQQYAAQERLYQRSVEEMQEHYEQEIARIQYEKTQITRTLTLENTNGSTGASAAVDQEVLLRPYLAQIERLKRVIQQLEYQLEAAGARIQQLQQEQERSSRLAALAHHNFHSEEQITQTESQQNHAQITVFQQHTELRENHQVQTEEMRINRQEAQAHQSEEGSSENEVEEPVEEDRRPGSSIKGSLIQQLQKEQSMSEGSQVRGGLITIKIQNPGSYVPSSPPSQPIPVYGQNIIQVQPQYIQGPNGQQIRVIQQVPQQVYVIPQQPAPYPVPIQGGQAGHPAVYQAAVAQPNIPRPRNYINIAAPVGAQPFRSLP